MEPKQYTKYPDGVKISGLKDEVNETIKKINEKREDRNITQELLKTCVKYSPFKPKTK